MSGDRDDVGDEAGQPVEVEIGEVFDLHSFAPHEVASVVRAYLDAAVEAGFEEIRLIHGRGIGAQRRTVRRILADDPRVVELHDAPPEAGGWGATCARLRSDER